MCMYMCVYIYVESNRVTADRVVHWLRLDHPFCGWRGGAVGFCVGQSWLGEWVPQVRFSVDPKYL